MLRAVPTFALLAALTGCWGGPSALVHHRPGEEPVTVPAPRSGTYALYREGGHCAQVAVFEGSAVGFAWDEGRRLEALAGQERVPVEPGSYGGVAAEAKTAGEKYRELLGGDGLFKGVEQAATVASAPFQAALFACAIPLWFLMGCPISAG